MHRALKRAGVKWRTERAKKVVYEKESGSKQGWDAVNLVPAKTGTM
jgi:hypothetical protein